MNNPLTLLVVEDQPRHLEDVAAMLDEVLPRFPVKVDLLYAVNLEEALQLLPRADMVMTDVAFLDGPGGTMGTYGKVVIEQCVASRKAVVWVGDLLQTDESDRWGREHGFMCFSHYSGQTHEFKLWEQALYGLIFLHIAIEEGHCHFVDGGIWTEVGPKLPAVYADPTKRLPFGGLVHTIGFGYRAWRLQLPVGRRGNLDHPACLKMQEMGFRGR